MHGDPVNFVDPTGLVESWSCVLTANGYDCGMTIGVSWADELSAATGGPPEFGGPIMRGIGGLEPGGGGGVLRLRPDQIAALRGLVTTLSDTCMTFINRLVSSVTGSPYDARTSLPRDVDSIKAGTGGFFFQSGRHGGGAVGTVDAGNAKVDINISHSGEAISSNLIGFLHEMIHVITGANDNELSERVRKLGITVLDYPGHVTRFPTDQTNSDLGMSGYWGQALKNACTERGY